MAVESNGVDIGWLLSNFDARNSAITGTTLGGPNGSGQYLAVKMSTVDGTIGLATANTDSVLGILQNKPAVGEAADVRILGVSKTVAGSTTITPALDLMADTDGQVIPYSSAAGKPRLGKAVLLGGAVTAVGQVFSALIYGDAGGGSIA